MSTYLVKGSRSKKVRILQRALGVTADGVFGPDTEAAVVVYQEANDLEPDGIVGPMTWAKITATDSASSSGELPTPSSSPESGGRLSWVGAWCGSRSLSNPERDVAFAQSIGLDGLVIMVHDVSKARAPRSFQLRSTSKILALADAINGAGLDVGLCLWGMPHRKYLEKAAREIISLARDANAVTVEWDAEEPWTQATNGMGYRDASALIGDLFAERTFRMGANAIGFTPQDKFAPLAEVCDYVVPQAYSTSTSKQSPADAAKKFHKRFLQFGEVTRIGLAAYRQDGIAGYTPTSAMETAIRCAASTGVAELCYWGLDALRMGDKEVAAVVARAKEL